MKVGELAELTGTTVRTVRHYHALGLLPVPRETNGWRDYDLSHVARLSRIRWLVDAGLSLPAIEGIVGTATDDPRGDLQAVLEGIDLEIASLAARRARLAGLLQRLDAATARTPESNDVMLTPVPPVVARYYAAVEARATTDSARRSIRRERDFVELAYYRGDMPPQAELLFELVDDATLADSLASFQAHAGALSEDAIVRQAEHVAARMIARFDEQSDTVAPAIDPEVIRRVYDLFTRVADEREARLAMGVRDRILAEIERRNAR